MNILEKQRRLKRLVEMMVRQELKYRLTEAETGPGANTEDDSSAAVKKVLKFLESPMFKSKMTSIKNDMHKAELIVRFAALVGIPSTKRQAIINKIKSLSA